MSGDYSAIAIAVVGVFGTLTAPIVSQQLSARARRADFEMQNAVRLDEQQRSDTRERLQIRRSCYVGFMATARNYRIEILNYLYAERQGGDDISRRDMEDARRAYISSFAEVQVTASPPVLTMIEPFNFGLSRAYGFTNGQEGREPIKDTAYEEVDMLMKELWDNQWKDTREAMRQDLRVSGRTIAPDNLDVGTS
jgi:hypothetical protein